MAGQRARFVAAIAAAAWLSGCALLSGKPVAEVPTEALSASDAHMAKFGFRPLPDTRKPAQAAAFDRIRRVYVKGSGPKVILLHELPGLRDGDIEVGVALSNDFEVYMPLLFGAAGQEDTNLGIKQACNSRLFNCNDRNTRHSIVTDLLAMTNAVCGGECGVIGMCLTGTLPLSLMAAPGVVAMVMAQPTLPIVWHIWPFAGLDISAEDTATAMAAATQRKASIYLLRYRGDRISGRTAFNRLVKRIAPAKDQLSFFEVAEVAGHGHSTLVKDSKQPNVAGEQLQAVAKALNARLRARR